MLNYFVFDKKGIMFAANNNDRMPGRHTAIVLTAAMHRCPISTQEHRITLHGCKSTGFFIDPTSKPVGLPNRNSITDLHPCRPSRRNRKIVSHPCKHTKPNQNMASHPCKPSGRSRKVVSHPCKPSTGTPNGAPNPCIFISKHQTS